MKKFVRKLKTFEAGSTQTPAGELYILNENGGSADQAGGGLVRELPSRLIGRLRDDLKFAAKIQAGAAKSKGRLKDEMAVVTRDAYVSKGVARDRLGQVLKQKVARGRESIQFFKHNLAKQKVASLKAAQIHVHDENVSLKIRVDRKNHELGVQTTALQAVGAVSAYDERMLREKDNEITNLQDVVEKLHHDLLQEKQRTEIYKNQTKDTQTQLYRVYSTLGKLAMKTGKASDKALVYDLNKEEKDVMIRGKVLEYGSDSHSDYHSDFDFDDTTATKKVEKKNARKLLMKQHGSIVGSPLLTPKTASQRKTSGRKGIKATNNSTTKTKRLARPQSATAATTRRNSRRRRRDGGMGRGRGRDEDCSCDNSPSASNRKRRPSSAHTSRSSRRFKKKVHPYLERGRKYGPGWKSPNYATTPLGQQAASIFPKSPAPVEAPLLKLRKDSDGRTKVKLRAGFNDCYSEEHLAALLNSTHQLPPELRPRDYFPPPPPKGWQQLCKEENDRLLGKHKEQRSHRYLRWYPAVARGQQTPPTISPSPLRAMTNSNPRTMSFPSPQKRSSISVMADWLEKSRDRSIAIHGSGMTGEREEGIEQGPNLKSILKELPPPRNQQEIAALEAQEKEEIPELYAISRKHEEYPNVNSTHLFEFDEKNGQYRHVHHKMPESEKEVKRRLERAASAPTLGVVKQKTTEYTNTSVSKDPTAKRTASKSKKKRPKSARLLSRRKEKAMLNRLTNSIGSRFSGPGYVKQRHIVRTSGSAAYQMKKMREKIRKKAAENAFDKD